MKILATRTTAAIMMTALACGCQNTRPQRVPAPPGPTVMPGQPPAFPAPAAGAVVTPGVQVPAAPAPVNPAPTFPPSGTQIPAAPAPASPGPSRYAPEQRSQDRWEPAPGNVKLMPPEPVKTESAKVPPNAVESKPSDSKAPAAAKSPPPPPPVGIPQFNPFKEGVAVGLRPSLDDGLDWLQANGYHTVLHVRAPAEDDSADRKQVEKRRMTYLSVEVSPETLSKKTVEDFSRIVADKIAYPLFVYDRDGARSGGLWYLYFRRTEQDTDDVARVRAGALGFREDRDDSHRSMWLAVQTYLKTP